MLQRKHGATLSEIMEKMGWQKHTVRGFMAGAMKKLGAVIVVARPWQLTKSAGRLGESETLAAGEHQTESNPHLPPPQPFSSSERNASISAISARMWTGC
jgi:hypothetical protein